MLNALESVVSVLLLIALGFGLAKRGWFDDQATALAARLVVSVALPAYMVANLMGGYDRARLLAMLPGLPVPFAVMLASFGIGRAVAKAARLPSGRRGTFASMFSLSNTIFIGLPVNLVLFGDASLPYVLLYYVANTTLFWSIGVYGIARDGSARGGTKAARFISREGLARMLSPPLLAFLVSSILILAGLRLPAFLLDLSRTVGNMTTPLSMIFIGSTIAAVDWKTVRPGLDMALLLGGRFVLAPLLIVLAVGWLDFPVLMKKVFLIQATMPAMTQTPIVARAYGADAEYAGIMTSITTVASLVTIPLFMGLIGYLF
jgi:predicted permease